MSNYKNVLPLFVISLLFSGVFVSCSENNPINNDNDPSIVDSNLFVWKFDTLQIRPSLGMYIADTNKIFIPGNHYSVYINNGSIQYISHNDNDFAGWSITGTDVNNVYIGGSSISQNRSKLKKWNGSAIEDIPMPIDTSNDIYSMEAVSPNDIWIATDKPIVYRYYNQIFYTYRFNNYDTNLVTGIIFKDKSGEIFTHFLKYASGENDYVYMFKFENESWVQISKDPIEGKNELQTFIGFSDNKMLYSGKNAIYYFTGNKWEKYINLNSKLSGSLWGCGKNETSILFQAEENNFQTYNFYYDGNHFYRIPNNVFPCQGYMGMQYKFGRFYVSLEEDWMGNSFLGTAKFK